MNETYFQLDHVCKSFHTVKAVNDVSFSIGNWYARRWKCCNPSTHAMSSGNNARLYSARRQSTTNMTTSVMKNVNTSEITLTRPELRVSESVFT